VWAASHMFSVILAALAASAPCPIPSTAATKTPSAKDGYYDTGRPHSPGRSVKVATPNPIQSGSSYPFFLPSRSYRDRGRESILKFVHQPFTPGRPIPKLPKSNIPFSWLAPGWKFPDLYRRATNDNAASFAFMQGA